jgi:hypothetical protein
VDPVVRLTPYDEIVEIFVRALEDEQVPIEGAYWVYEDEDKWRLYLVQKPLPEGVVLSTRELVKRYMDLFGQITEVKSRLLDRMPDLDDVIIRLVGPENAVVQAFAKFHHIGPDAPKKVSFLNAETAYIERALILKAA